MASSILVSIVSDNGLSPNRRQTITWSNTDILSNGPLRTNLSEICIKIQTFSLKKVLFKMLSAKWQPFCLGFFVLIHLKNRMELLIGFKQQAPDAQLPGKLVLRDFILWWLIFKALLWGSCDVSWPAYVIMAVANVLVPNRCQSISNCFSKTLQSSNKLCAKEVGKPVLFFQHIKAETKWLTFPRWHFQMHFLEWNCVNFNLHSTEFCSQEFS